MKQLPEHTQIIHLDNKTKAVIHNINFIEQGTLLHINTSDGQKFIFNNDRILFTEIIHEKN